MMKNVILSIVVATLFALTPQTLWAQATGYTLDGSSTMTIKGTSSIHDWEAAVEQMDVEANLAVARLEQEEPVNPVEQLMLSVPVESIESGKGRMNRKLYDALKSDDHPNISFKLASASITDRDTASGTFTLQATGTLTVAGVSREVTFPVNATRIASDTFRFEGSYALNMKTYDVDPPSAMLGAIRTGEEVDIVFNILLTKQAGE